MEIAAEFEPETDARCLGLKVYASDDGSGFVRVFFDSTTNDFGVEASILREPGGRSGMPEGRGPSFIPRGEPVRMHVFLDKGLLEVFVNGRTCTTAAPERLRRYGGIDLFSEGGVVRCTRLDIWSMEPAGAG